MVCLANRAASRFLRRAPQTAHAAARSIRDKRAPTGSLTRQRNRYSSSSSQQAGLQRRPARPERQLALILLRRSALQVAKIVEVFGSQKAAIITSFSMFYDLEDPLSFMWEIADVLADDGIWVFEQSYMPTML